MYKKFGYTVFRRVINYYSGEEDAYGASRGAQVPIAVWVADDPTGCGVTPRADMRKALPRDKDKASVVPLDHPVHPNELWD